jgi:hypothetical protein
LVVKGTPMPKEPRKTTTRAAATRKPTLRRKKAAPAVELTPEQVATRAYFLHLEQPWADPHENWVRAESELAAAV